MDFLKKKDYLYPLLICILVGFVSGLNYYTFGNFLYDCGREFLVSDAVNEGHVLIKNIFISYFPLSYQINAILLKFFGSSLDTLRITGVCCSFLICLFFYFISREFHSENKSLLITVIVSFITMFNVSYLSNYVLPYSYAFIYGVLSLFVSLFFALKFIKEDKFLYPSFLFLGLSFSFKAEFIFILVPYVLMLFYKKCSFKKWIISLIFYFLPIVSSFLFLFIQGFNIEDLKNYFLFIKEFMNSDILKFYNDKLFLKNPIDWVSLNFKNFIIFLVNFLVCLPFLFLSSKFNKKWLNFICYFVCFILIFVFSIIKGNFSAGEELSWLIFPVVFVLYESIKNKNFPLLFLTLVSVALIFRFNFLYSTSYLTYTMPVALLACLIYFADKFKKITVFMLIFSVVNVFYFSLSQSFFAKNEIKTEKGKMIIPDKSEADVINQTLKFIENEIKPDETVLILPEGAMFNYLTERKTNLKYYQLIPNHIETVGENEIISDLKSNKPDYILFLNNDYSIYGTPKFCSDFGKDICGYVYKNYAEVKNFGNNSELNIRIFSLLKLKDQ